MTSTSSKAQILAAASGLCFDSKMMTNDQDANGPGDGFQSALPKPLHQGKWTPEEEEYVECLIQEFKSGLLPLAEGTSLRIFLSKMLNCDPMRISKKFVGSNYNGKQLYVRRPNTMAPEEVMQRRKKLRELEQKFLKRVLPLANIEMSMQGKNSEGSLSASGAGAQDASVMDGGMAPFSSSANANSKAAAAGRALLQGMNSGGLKSAMQAQNKTGGLGNLENASSLELFAELQRRASSDKGESSFLAGSSSSLGLAAELQQRANTESTLKRTFSRNSSSNLLDPALEVALNSLESKNTQSAMSLSGVLGRQNSADSLANHALLTKARRSFGSMLDVGDLSGAASNPEGGRNWLPGTLSSRSSADSLSGLIAQLSDKTSQPSSLRNHGSMGVSNSNLDNLFLSMKKGGSGSESARGNASFSNLKNSSAAALTNMINSSSFGDLNASEMQNQGFQKKQIPDHLSGQMTEYLLQQRLKARDNNDSEKTNRAALMGLRKDSVSNLSMGQMSELLHKKRRLDEGISGNSTMDQMRELLKKKRRVEEQKSSGNLSMEQMRDLLMNRRNEDRQQLQSNPSMTQMQELLAKKRERDQDISGNMSGNPPGSRTGGLSGNLSIDQMRELLTKQRSSSQQSGQFFNDFN